MTPHIPRCQGFAVAYYGFTLGRLGSWASSTFAQLGLHCNSVQQVLPAAGQGAATMSLGITILLSLTQLGF